MPLLRTAIRLATAAILWLYLVLLSQLNLSSLWVVQYRRTPFDQISQIILILMAPLIYALVLLSEHQFGANLNSSDDEKASKIP